MQKDAKASEVQRKLMKDGAPQALVDAVGAALRPDATAAGQRNNNKPPTAPQKKATAPKPKQRGGKVGAIRHQFEVKTKEARGSAYAQLNRTD